MSGNFDLFSLYINIVMEQIHFLFYKHFNSYNVKKVTFSYVLAFLTNIVLNL